VLDKYFVHQAIPLGAIYSRRMYRLYIDWR